MSGDGKRTVLFICTGNSCRSQMAEALLTHIGGDRFVAHSAGSHPAGYVHPLAVAALKHIGCPVGESRSKSWDEYANTAMDVVITVCDAAAGESCPVWPGDPIRAHWSLPDPVQFLGTSDERIQFAVTIAGRIRNKIQAFIDLDWSISKSDLQNRIARIGEI